METKPTAQLFIMVLFFAVVFYQLRQRDTVVLLAGLLITLWGYMAYTEWARRTEQAAAEDTASAERLTEIPPEFAKKALPLAPIDAQFLPKKNTRYIRTNPHLVALLKDLQFTKAFNTAGYYHLVLLLDRFQKAYIYLLIQRTRIQDGVPIFYDLYESALESIYSMAVHVPVKLRHTYGLTPHERIQAQIANFQGIFKTMVEVLRNFAELELKLPYFPEWLPSSASLYRERKNVLP